MTCEICKESMPARYLFPLITSQESYRNVCPECARKRVGEIHGVENYQFQGKQAQYILKEFLEWKKRREAPNEH